MSTVAPSTKDESLTSERHPLLLFFDGECAFCNRWVNRVKLADHQHCIRYGAKQGRTFQQLTQAHPELANVELIVLVKRRDNDGEDFLVRTAAVREVVKILPDFRLFDWVLRIIPTPICNLGYRIFSKLRLRLFGKLNACPIPLEEEKDLYVE